MFARFPLYAQLVRLEKPIGILLLLWPTLIGLWVATNGRPSRAILVIFVVGTLLMRSAGCAINDFADRHFDRCVERTHNRPITSGCLAPWEGVAIAVVLFLSAFMLIARLNVLTRELSAVALMLATAYPFTKRFFAIPQAVLGAAYGFGIPMAFAAVQDHVPLVAWAMFAANVFWSIAYDTEYAMVDREDDIKLGICTSALTFGRYDVAAILLCYAVTFTIYAGVGVIARFGIFYWLGWMGAISCAIYHYFLIRDREREGCFEAFKHNNWLGGALFAGVAINYLTMN